MQNNYQKTHQLKIGWFFIDFQTRKFDNSLSMMMVLCARYKNSTTITSPSFAIQVWHGFCSGRYPQTCLPLGMFRLLSDYHVKLTSRNELVKYSLKISFSRCFPVVQSRTAATMHVRVWERTVSIPAGFVFPFYMVINECTLDYCIRENSFGIIVIPFVC